MKKTKSTKKVTITKSTVGIAIASAVASSLLTHIVKSVATSKKVTEKNKMIDEMKEKISWFEEIISDYEKIDDVSDLYDEEPSSYKSEPEIVKVAERPSFDGTYEGTINTPEKTGDDEFDALMNNALDILEKIEEDHYDISEKHNNFEDIAFSILNGIYIYKDDLDDHKEEIEESAKRALKSFKTEDGYDYIPYASSSKAIRMHRDEMKKLCDDLLTYFNKKKEKENNAGDNKEESNDNISVTEAGGETEESNSGDTENDNTGSFINPEKE